MLKIINMIVEIITAPFNALIKSNGISIDGNKITKPLIVLGISIVILTLFIVYFYVLKK